MKKSIIIYTFAAIFLSCQSANIHNNVTSANPADLGKYIVQLENSLLPQFISERWGERRIQWMTDIRSDGISAGSLARLLVEFETEMLPSAFRTEWVGYRMAWRSQVKSASSAAELARLVIELENSIHIGAQFSSWRGWREEWLSGVRALIGNISRGVSSNDSFGNISTGVSSNDSFGQLLIELESSVYYSAQTPQWRVRRASWIAEVRSSGNDIVRLKFLLLEFEQEILVSAQSPQWLSTSRASRVLWVQRVRNAANISELALLLLEVETSILYNAQVPNWRQVRTAWISRVRALSRATGSGYY